jgi:hypothetical protein
MTVRRIELAAALATCVVGLVCASMLYGALNSAWMAGIGNSSGMDALRAEGTRDIEVASLLVVGVAVGGFFHSVFGLRAGLVLLWMCSLFLLAGLVYAVSMPGALVQANIYFSIALPWWLPAAVLTVVFAGISAGASVTPSGWSATEPHSISQRV